MNVYHVQPVSIIQIHQLDMELKVMIDYQGG